MSNKIESKELYSLIKNLGEELSKKDHIWSTELLEQYKSIFLKLSMDILKEENGKMIKEIESFFKHIYSEKYPYGVSFWQDLEIKHIKFPNKNINHA
jgi:hypothetical protein